MTSSKFERPGTFERPGPIGRVIRLLAGSVMLSFFILTLTGYADFVSLDIPRHPIIWLGVALSLFALPGVVNIGFMRTWGRWPQLIVVLLALAAVVFDLFRYGSLWGPPVGLLVFVLLAYVTGHLGLSFILAGICATPG